MRPKPNTTNQAVHRYLFSKSISANSPPPRPSSSTSTYYKTTILQARLPEQFDFVLHFDETRAVEPLERDALWGTGEVAETFPSGL